ncbi:hypothetical protein CY34DRAFT_422567 [Suillus luteus UH-Slu-Lm8-n1]|uniref:Uncharacterized protein n=1 Tax=Suillus luteus UH-Slu-Lm8-n1 TaxID=930992 RepID=A0A0C9ZKB9_9AGAM|nr:hypothetical protein CY34DRAFT_422567 [Suillus luteus UH-Slu-Lm8-n1]
MLPVTTMAVGTTCIWCRRCQDRIRTRGRTRNKERSRRLMPPGLVARASVFILSHRQHPT